MENSSTKTDNFLKAIQKYADEQRNAMRSEIDQLKEEKIKEAENKGKHDSEKYIKDKLEEIRNKETSILAKKMQASQKELFLVRAEMTDKIFKKAEEKLIEYTKTSDYYEYLINNAKNISSLFGDNECILHVNEHDLKNADKIRAVCETSCEILSDKSVRIGGIKGYCKAINIVADETLDSKLNAQREWFVENSNLSVL